MDSDKSDEEDQDVISKQILEYYKKYSQNKQLTKYFSGSSLSYMPQIVKEEEFVVKPTPIIVIDDTTSVQKQPTEIQEVAEIKPESPTSSITSNRKLEWDNGADIGYSNIEKKSKLHKSLSLPILLDNTIKNFSKTTKPKLASQIITISYSSSEDNPSHKETFFSSSSSTSNNVEPAVPVTSSSSSSGKINTKLTTSSSSLTNTVAYLKSRIGLPDAESTPKVDFNIQKRYVETPLAPKNKKLKSTKSRIVNLCITKPISVECFDNIKKRGSDKIVQTSIAEGLSKCVQTGDSLEVVDEICNKPPVENQSVIIISYESGDSQRQTSNSNVQTDVEMAASPCDSFEYYRENREPVVINVDNSKENSAKSNLVSSTDSSKDYPLGQLISEKQSTSMIADIDKSITILQKLLKSKRYDPTTKKRYIKKIVDKIVDGKYTEDSTTSSELFIPKKQNNDARQRLQENIPWYPPQMSKFSIKTFSDEFLPSESQIASKRKSLFTLKQSSGATGDSLEEPRNTSSGSYQSWKEEKTLSERLLEEKKGQGDQLVKFAMKERQHQISWINDEISHLTKLKGLLEKKIQRTTTVYMVSQHYDPSAQGSCSCSDSQSDPPRNYVIQTELSTSTSSDVPINYNLYEKSGKKNYQVKALESKPGDVKLNRRVVGDIEVVSDEKTTNIKIKTRKVSSEQIEGETSKASFKPKLPTLVGLGKYDTFPRSKAELSRWPCSGKCHCAALERNRSSQFYGNPKEYASNIALNSKPKPPHDINSGTNKFTTTTSYDSMQTCSCGCRCKQSKLNQPDTEVVVRLNGINKENPTTSSTELPKTEESSVKGEEDREIESAHELPKYVESVSKGKADGQVQAIATENGRSQTDKCDCIDKGVQACICSKNGSTKSLSNKSQSSSPTYSTSSTFETTGSTSTESLTSCVCCKRQNVTAKHLQVLRKKLSDEARPLCRPCYQQNRRGVYSPNYFSNPTHVCNCYTLVQTNTLNQIKKTINDLNQLENEYCTCVKGPRRNTSECCKYCKCKLSKTSKNKNGIAYMLTFENETFIEEEKRKKHKKKPYLEEIKIKIPVSYKKKHKDKENKRKKANKHNGSDTSTTENRKVRRLGLQEYLCKNRPDFVEVAEERRKVVNDSKMQREEMSDYKKMLFLEKCKEDCDRNVKKLFSEKEMKDITKRNYKKLPEVQRKLNDNREKQLRQANRLMADTFNRKMRENVLKGKRSLPTDVNVINS